MHEKSRIIHIVYVWLPPPAEFTIQYIGKRGVGNVITNGKSLAIAATRMYVHTKSCGSGLWNKRSDLNLVLHFQIEKLSFNVVNQI